MGGEGFVHENRKLVRFLVKKGWKVLNQGPVLYSGNEVSFVKLDADKARGMILKKGGKIAVCMLGDIGIPEEYVFGPGGKALSQDITAWYKGCVEAWESAG